MKDDDYIRHEFIGRKIKVIKSSDRSKEGVEGIVIDETKNMFVIRDREGRNIKVPKKATWFLIYFDDKIIKIYGELINIQPHKRIRRRYPKKYKYDW